MPLSTSILFPTLGVAFAINALNSFHLLGTQWIDDYWFLPIQFSKESSCLGELKHLPNPNKNDVAMFYQFDKKYLHHLHPHSFLPFAVIGLKEKKLQILPLDKGYKVYAKPFSFQTSTFESAISCGITATLPRFAFKTFRGSNCWHSFCSWKYIHCFVGDCIVPRTHTFFRPIREVPPRSHFRSASSKPNFISFFDSHLDLGLASVKTSSDSSSYNSRACFSDCSTKSNIPTGLVQLFHLML